MPDMSPPHGIFDRAVSQTLGWTEGILLAALTALALGLLALAIAVWRRKRGRRRQIPSNPWDELRSQLQPTLGQTPVDRMRVLNYTLRKGLELRTRRPFTAWTSREVLEHLQTNLEFSSDFQAQCGEFLRTADRVLFAHEPWDRESGDRYERQISVWLDNIQLGRPL